ncbi:hypothetical protein [Silvimonas iriomotensis]|nr:hypothetical protein [Silvimonas iriomotensis]
MKRYLLLFSFLACTAIVETVFPAQCQLITNSTSRQKRQPE